MKKLVVFMALAGLVVPALADIVLDAIEVDHFTIGVPESHAATRDSVMYSNVTNFLGQAYAQGPAVAQTGNGITYLVADDITPVGGGNKLAQFKFTTANLNTAAVVARPRVRFYMADGAGGAPGTYFGGYTFNPLTLNVGVTTWTATVDPNTSPLMPTTTFWAGVTFDNNTGGTGATLAQLSNLGQGIFNPPTIGTSADQAFKTSAQGSFTANNPAGALFNFGGNPVANFGWEFTIIPEPASLGLLVLGGLALLRRR